MDNEKAEFNFEEEPGEIVVVGSGVWLHSADTWHVSGPKCK